MEDDVDEALSASDPSDSGDEFTGEFEDDPGYKSSNSDNDDDDSAAKTSTISPAPPNHRKSQNVDALLR